MMIMSYNIRNAIYIALIGSISCIAAFVGLMFVAATTVTKSPLWLLGLPLTLFVDVWLIGVTRDVLDMDY